MRIGSLFSGIGGLELGLEMSGLGHTVWQVEQSEFCRAVLAKHWPDARRYDDVRTVGAANLSRVDLIAGGFPCTDLSAAGKGEGLAGSRSGLWFEFRRIIEELRPRWVVIENVAIGASRWLDPVRASLGECGYEAIPFPLSAYDVGAPHLRKRLFVVARDCRPSSPRRSTTNADGQRLEERRRSIADAPEVSGPWSTRSHLAPLCGVGHGIPDRLDRLKALGNAVVPQCAEVIGWIIRELEAA